MRALIAALLLAAGLWIGYWVLGSTAKREAITAWLDARRAAGWTVEYSDYRVTGFPYRFDSDFRDLTLRDPASGLGWQLPRLVVYLLAYKPNHIIAGFPERQVIEVGRVPVTVKSKGLQASVVFQPDTSLAVLRTALRGKEIVVSAPGWSWSAASLAFSTRQNADIPDAHDVVLDLGDTTPTAAFRRALDPQNSLPERIQTLFLDARADFDGPWDRIAIERGAPRLTGVTINRLLAGWGKLGLQGSGRLDIAADGRIAGRIDLVLRNWRGVLDLARRAGLIDRDQQRNIETVLALVTAASDDPDSLRLPLVLAQGTMSLGPVPLGPAPRLGR